MKNPKKFSACFSRVSFLVLGLSFFYSVLAADVQYYYTENFADSIDYSCNTRELEFIGGKTRLKYRGVAGGMISCWRLDESSFTGAAGDVRDCKGSRHGRSYGDPVSASDGKYGNAIQLDADEDRVKLDYPMEFTSLTVSAWFRVEGDCTGGGCQVFSSHGMGNSGWIGIRLLYNGDRMQLRGTDGAAPSQYFWNIKTYKNDDIWHHIVATYDETTGKARVYGDGELKVEYSGLDLGVIKCWHPTYGVYPYYIGSRTQNDGFFNGSIDDLAIWDRAISGEEVSSIYYSDDPVPETFYARVAKIQPLQVHQPTILSDYHSFTEDAVKPAGTEIKYQLQIGGAYYWWDGGSWSAAGDTTNQANTAQDITDHISSLAGDVTTAGPPSLSWRAYVMSDAAGEKQVELNQVSFIYTRPNDAPYVTSSLFGTSFDEDTSVELSAHTTPSLGADTDNDPLVIDIVTDPEHGQITLSPGDRTVTYTPNMDFCGTDSFEYRLYDGIEYSPTNAVFMLTVNPINDAPRVQTANGISLMNSTGDAQEPNTFTPIMVSEGVSKEITFTIYEVESEPYTFSVSGLCRSGGTLQAGGSTIATTPYVIGHTLTYVPDPSWPTATQAKDVFTVSATDGMVTASVDVYVEVEPNTPPVVSAGADQTVYTRQITLSGSATDDGNPTTPGVMTVNWSQVSGPETAVFKDASNAASQVTLPKNGIYLLRLTASDSLETTADDVSITVQASDPALAYSKSEIFKSGVRTHYAARYLGGGKFDFQVTYTEPAAGRAPDPVQVWLDKNGDGEYGDDEKYDLTTAGSDYTAGVTCQLLNKIIEVKPQDKAYASGKMRYRFYAKAGENEALGEATEPKTLTFKISLDLSGGRTVASGPSPFDPGAQITRIVYSAEKKSAVDIFIFSLSGKTVWRCSVDALPGAQSVVWDGKNSAGTGVGSGVYLCRLIIRPEEGGEARVYTTKIVVLRR